MAILVGVRATLTCGVEAGQERMVMIQASGGQLNAGAVRTALPTEAPNGLRILDAFGWGDILRQDIFAS